jgi:hypothetical protein
LGKRFWPLLPDERKAVAALFAQENTRKLVMTMRRFGFWMQLIGAKVAALLVVSGSLSWSRLMLGNRNGTV